MHCYWMSMYISGNKKNYGSCRQNAAKDDAVAN